MVIWSIPSKLQVFTSYIKMKYCELNVTYNNLRYWSIVFRVWQKNALYDIITVITNHVFQKWIYSVHMTQYLRDLYVKHYIFLWNVYVFLMWEIFTYYFTPIQLIVMAIFEV